MEEVVRTVRREVGVDPPPTHHGARCRRHRRKDAKTSAPRKCNKGWSGGGSGRWPKPPPTPIGCWVPVQSRAWVCGRGCERVHVHEAAVGRPAAPVQRPCSVPASASAVNRCCAECCCMWSMRRSRSTWDCRRGQGVFNVILPSYTME